MVGGNWQKKSRGKEGWVGDWGNAQTEREMRKGERGRQTDHEDE